MFGLMRRISSGFIPRADRPWQEDATSNAPSIGKKRRRNSTEDDVDDIMDGGSTPKKARGDTPAEAEQTTVPVGVEQTQTQTEAEAVKEVTEGVKDVGLGDRKQEEKGEVVESQEGREEKTEVEADVEANAEATNEAKVVEEAESQVKEPVVAPESVPLPEEVYGELDDSASIRSTPPAEDVDGQASDEFEASKDGISAAAAVPAETEDSRKEV